MYAATHIKLPLLIRIIQPEDPEVLSRSTDEVCKVQPTFNDTGFQLI